MLRVVCASANPDKVAEIALVLAGEVDLVARPDGVADVVEDADSLQGNALLKAAAIADATGIAAIADDTGLEVDALDGEPGVHTARYAGEGCSYADNRAKMLRELAGVDEPLRTARFRTVALVAWPDGRRVAAEGVCSGHIATTERGTRGFGYDAIFVPTDGDGRTFAEMTIEEKDAISHRARAFKALLEELRRQA